MHTLSGCLAPNTFYIGVHICIRGNRFFQLQRTGNNWQTSYLGARLVAFQNSHREQGQKQIPRKPEETHLFKNSRTKRSYQKKKIIEETRKLLGKL